MDDYYIRLFYLELKEECWEEDSQWETQKYYSGFHIDYMDEPEPKLTANFNSVAFWLSFNEADYANIYLGKKFIVKEHTIKRYVYVKPETPIRKKHKVRIIEQTRPDGKVQYVIQRKKLWWWFTCGDQTAAVYDTLEEAKEQLCWYDGTDYKERTIWP